MSGGSKRQRADRLMVERQLAASRTLAQSLIMAGRLFSGERRIEKAGTLLATDAPLHLVAGPRFVSRGGEKLDHALQGLEAHGLTVAGKTCLDVGAATGGFTDCLLQRGAAGVHAVDVGHGQLHPRLRADPRVVVRERTNARYLTAADFGARIELVVVDASFIGIGKLLGAIGSILGAGGELVALIKPQFEVGKRVARRARGVIRDAAERQSAIDAAVRDIEAAGFEVVAQRDSAVRGPKGNVEHFVYARRSGDGGHRSWDESGQLSSARDASGVGAPRASAPRRRAPELGREWANCCGVGTQAGSGPRAQQRRAAERGADVGRGAPSRLARRGRGCASPSRECQEAWGPVYRAVKKPTGYWAERTCHVSRKLA